MASTEVISETEEVNRPTVQVDAAFDTIVQVEVPEVPEVPEIHETSATSVHSHPSTVASTPLQGERSNIRSRTTGMQLRSNPTSSAKLATSVLVDAIKGYHASEDVVMEED
ncbi:hypothetical protein G6F37_012922 [Rhizopus arrhizus]|nr:hypothetical protein G6F38_012808 [Rhizopus arrhizus]KAG1140794.1 hypothetical protein G6F37_012922 [Rhizopus arrhizus]